MGLVELLHLCGDQLVESLRCEFAFGSIVVEQSRRACVEGVFDPPGEAEGVFYPVVERAPTHRKLAVSCVAGEEHFAIMERIGHNSAVCL